MFGNNIFQTIIMQNYIENKITTTNRHFELAGV